MQQAAEGEDGGAAGKQALRGAAAGSPAGIALNTIGRDFVKVRSLQLN